jgi:hypothetical protein
MIRSTYDELFQEHLHDLIGMGGDCDRVIHLVHCYERSDSAGRSALFAEWLQDQAFACRKCGGSFRPAIEQVRETDEVLCRWCEFSFVRLGQEPVPGWRRTWSR